MYVEDCPSPGDLIVTKEGADVHLHIRMAYFNFKRINQSHLELRCPTMLFNLQTLWPSDRVEIGQHFFGLLTPACFWRDCSNSNLNNEIGDILQIVKYEKWLVENFFKKWGKWQTQRKKKRVEESDPSATTKGSTPISKQHQSHDFCTPSIFVGS